MNKNDNFKIFLAPLAGYSDRSFRRIAAENGADGSVTEMVSCEGLARDSEKTKDLLKRFNPNEKLIVQLFGPSLDPIKRCLDYLLDFKPDGIDLNCGCPVNKIVKNGAGSALMKNPKAMYEMVSYLKQNTNLPISVKFRLGWDFNDINYLSFASQAAEAGASMLCLHARTRSQAYEGSASWKDIKILKEEFKNTPVKIFGSGDIFSANAAINMFRETGVDGVMVARGAIGNPFIFNEIKELLKTGEIKKISIQERKETMLKHLDYMINDFGDVLAIKEMRKHACSYIKGIPGANKIKVKIVTSKSRENYIQAFNELCDSVD